MQGIPRSVALAATTVLVALPLLLVGVAIPAASEPDENCDPYPVGRCGAFQREATVYCYLPVPGGNENRVWPSPTDTHVVAVGGNPPNVVSVESGNAGQFYVRLKPTETLVADPFEAPFPYGTVWKERNLFSGLQPAAYECANFVWFAECEPPQWMGPFNAVRKLADEKVF